MFKPQQSRKEPSETIRVSFPLSTVQMLKDIAAEAKSEVSEIIRQAVDYAIASMQSPASKPRGRKPATKAAQPSPEK